MSEKGCIIEGMKKGIKENPTLKKYLDKNEYGTIYYLM